MPPTYPPIWIHNTHSILHPAPIELFVDASSPWSIAKNRDPNSDSVIRLDCGAVSLLEYSTTNVSQLIPGKCPIITCPIGHKAQFKDAMRSHAFLMRPCIATVPREPHAPSASVLRPFSAISSIAQSSTHNLSTYSIPITIAL